MKYAFIIGLITILSLAVWFYRDTPSELKGNPFVPEPLAEKINILGKEYSKEAFVLRKKELSSKLKTKTINHNEVQEWAEIASQEVLRCTNGKITITENLVEEINKIVEQGC